MDEFTQPQEEDLHWRQFQLVKPLSSHVAGKNAQDAAAAAAEGSGGSFSLRVVGAQSRTLCVEFDQIDGVAEYYMMLNGECCDWCPNPNPNVHNALYPC